jgi:hypothetical protein
MINPVMTIRERPMVCVKWVIPIMMMLGLSSVAHADDLCPDIAKGEKGLSVNDMADLQFDIGRLNLCLQRARLLQQIDEIFCGWFRCYSSFGGTITSITY